jgi:hypothetical protein
VVKGAAGKPPWFGPQPLLEIEYVLVGEIGLVLRMDNVPTILAFDVGQQPSGVNKAMVGRFAALRAKQCRSL